LEVFYGYVIYQVPSLLGSLQGQQNPAVIRRNWFLKIFFSDFVHHRTWIVINLKFHFLSSTASLNGLISRTSSTTEGKHQNRNSGIV
jgi:hypothetical protein